MTLKDNLSFHIFSPEIQNTINFLDTYLDTSFIIQLYGFRHNGYHNLNHIDELLKTLDTHQTDISHEDTYKLKNEDLFALVCVIIFHDVIYIATEGDNEDKSAEIAQHYLRQISVNETQVKIIGDVIRDSKDHIPRFGDYKGGNRRNYLGQLMFDLDFTPLGKSYNDFRDDGKRIFNEYSNTVSKEDFNKGRIQFLKSMFEKERIFNLDYFYNRYEVATRSNIQKEINERSKLL
ncbi:hypothetical protein PBI_SCTP2_120 [Salicola phage SCTP-2]|nr:hypothetical protein PBI_SCTP2_120 [Salicola phage SCTP-2]